ncbi:MAG: hypothetical protein H6742_01815 [Alphaproteobacteria bacterium]|nr:hypothetical protein [Alphaproteobacteria bacterium]
MSRSARIEAALGAIAAVLFAGVSVSARLEALDRTAIDRDWAWFLHSAGQLVHGHEWPGPLMYMYPRASSTLFGVLGWIFDGPLGGLVAFTAICAIAPGLTVEAVRRVAGLPAGLVAGAAMLLSRSQTWVATGLKSPYMLASTTAALAIGLDGCVRRRWWGPALVAGTAGMSVNMHVGFGPAAGVALVIAIVAVFFLPDARSRGAAVAGGLAFGAPWWWSLSKDLTRLAEDARQHSGSTGQAVLSADVIKERVGQGLSLTWEHGEQLAPVVGAAVLVAIGWRLLLRTRFAPERLRSAGPAHGRRLASTLLVLLVASTAAPPYIYNIYGKSYAEVHHFIGFVPLLLVGTAGALAAAAPPWPRGVGWLLAAAALAPWARDARDLHAVKPNAPVRSHHALPMLHLAEQIQATAPGRYPVLIGAPTPATEPDDVLTHRVLSELVHLRRVDDRELPPSCFWLSSGDLPEALSTLPALDLPADLRLTVVHDVDCRVTHELEPELCATRHDRRFLFRPDFAHAIPEWTVLPSCTWPGVNR